jgi:hypothetical protein
MLSTRLRVPDPLAVIHLFRLRPGIGIAQLREFRGIRYCAWSLGVIRLSILPVAPLFEAP